MPRLENVLSDPDILDKVARLYKQGKKDKEIAEILKLEPWTVQRCRIKRGLRKNRR